MGDAVFSDCGTYRYTLSRSRSFFPDEPAVVWIMLNPSTADARVDDPTIRRCLGFATRWGFLRLEVVNLFAFCTPHPRALRACAAWDRVGPDNDAHVRRITSLRGALVIAAWGTHGVLDGRGATVRSLLEDRGVELHHLGVTKDGHPKHPLARGRHRIADDQEPIRWT